MSPEHLLRDAAAKLNKAGVADAMRDARRLLNHAAGGSYLQYDLVPPAIIERFQEAIARRAMREPVSHIVGQRSFWKHEFTITSDVLDPRPETELLVELALAEPFSKVLELGVGSGCILISLLAENPKARGIGADICEKAVLVAGENAERIGVADRIVLPMSDWWEDLGGRYDLIVSNPPYIAAKEMADLSPELGYEPRIALTDEGDGLGAYRAIAAGLPNHLNDGGRVLVEIGPTQAVAVCAIFREAGLSDVHIHRDLDGRDRVISARLPGSL